MAHAWSPEDYLHNAPFVPALGTPLLERLAPRPGERILDLGCGDGTLTEQIVRMGATVVGVDSSPAMVAAAAARGLDARLMDATALHFEQEFDAVFSNAVLHWVPDAGAALRGVYRALRPGGRFAAELGGFMNVAAISVALRAVLDRHRATYTWPWYFPSADEYSARLEACGFSMDDVRLFARPTPLPTGIAGWLETFAGPLFTHVPAHQHTDLRQEIVDLLRPALCDHAGQWTADYVRLQAFARRPPG